MVSRRRLLLLSASCAALLPDVHADFALVREDTRLVLESADNSSEFNVVTQGRVVEIRDAGDNCTITTYKQSSCLITDGTSFNTYIDVPIFPGDGIVVIGDNDEVAICGRYALRTLCPTNVSTAYQGSNNVYSLKKEAETVAVIPTFGTTNDWCVGVCVNQDGSSLCFKFDDNLDNNCTFGNEWFHIAPSQDQSSSDGVTCKENLKCSEATRLSNSLLMTACAVVSALLLLQI